MCWLIVEPRRDYVHILVGPKGIPSPNSTTTGEEDVRPVCTGEVYGRLVGKALLKIELPVLRTHLLPHQLAVGVPAGSGWGRDDATPAAPMEAEIRR